MLDCSIMSRDLIIENSDSLLDWSLTNKIFSANDCKLYTTLNNSFFRHKLSRESRKFTTFLINLLVTSVGESNSLSHAMGQLCQWNVHLALFLYIELHARHDLSASDVDPSDRSRKVLISETTPVLSTGRPRCH